MAFHSPANISLGCLQVNRLFAPVSCSNFISGYFEQRHLYTRSAGFEGLVHASDLDTLAERWQFKIAKDHAQARVLLPDSFQHDTTYKDGMLFDGAAIRKTLAARRTVVLHNVELYSRPIGLLALALMRSFGVYPQANLYHSPAGLSSAVHAHQDAQSVFIVQCEGQKTWQLFAPPQRWRLRNNQRGKAGDVAPESELTQPLGVYTLRPGDVLFVPRGVYHRTSTHVEAEAAEVAVETAAEETAAEETAVQRAAKQLAAASGEELAATGSGVVGIPSLHVTIGIETDTDHWTWHALLKDAAGGLSLPAAEAKLDAAQWHDERLRAALPLSMCRPSASFDGADPHAAVWLATARDLLATHLGERPEVAALRRALEGALTARQEHVEKKRLQLLDFLAINAKADDDLVQREA